MGWPQPGFVVHLMAKWIGSASGLAVLVFAYLRKQNREESAIVRSFRFDASAAGKLLRYGSPTGLEMFSGFMAFNALVLIFHSRGLVTATAATIMLNWDCSSSSRQRWPTCFVRRAPARRS